MPRTRKRNQISIELNKDDEDIVKRARQLSPDETKTSVIRTLLKSGLESEDFRNYVKSTLDPELKDAKKQLATWEPQIRQIESIKRDLEAANKENSTLRSENDRLQKENTALTQNPLKQIPCPKTDQYISPTSCDKCGEYSECSTGQAIFRIERNRANLKNKDTL